MRERERERERERQTAESIERKLRELPQKKGWKKVSSILVSTAGIYFFPTVFSLFPHKRRTFPRYPLILPT